jgi:hypothetical protein
VTKGQCRRSARRQTTIPAKFAKEDPEYALSVTLEYCIDRKMQEARRLDFAGAV